MDGTHIKANVNLKSSLPHCRIPSNIFAQSSGDVDRDHRREGLYQRFAITDSSVVRYDSINLMSFSISLESNMRLNSSIARALTYAEERGKS